MRLITLLTDFGLENNFVGVMKGVICRINPAVQIIDISHNVRAGDIKEAAFLLKNSYKYFPKSTIYLVVVDPGVGTRRRAILVKTKNYFLVAPDNGVLSWALKDEQISQIIEIQNNRYFLKPVSNTFHGRDIFAPVAAWLSRGKAPQVFGKPIQKIKQIPYPVPEYQPPDKLLGEVIYIDHFGNLITNISQEEFLKFTKNPPTKSGQAKFEIKIKNYKISKISHSYGPPIKQPIVLVDSFDNLELALPGGNLAKSINIRKGEPIIVSRKK